MQNKVRTTWDISVCRTAYVTMCDCECIQLLHKCLITLHAHPHRLNPFYFFHVGVIVSIQGAENQSFVTLILLFY